MRSLPSLFKRKEKPICYRRQARVRGGFPVRAVALGDAESAHPVHVETALRPVQRPRLELALEVGLHLDQLLPQHLGVGDERIGPTVPHRDRLIDEVVRLGCLFGNRVDGVLEDVAFPRGHCRDASPRVCRQISRGCPVLGVGEAPQRAAAAGLPRTRLTKEGGVLPRSYGDWSPKGISALTDPRSM
jgi:hypothetical protein